MKKIAILGAGLSGVELGRRLQAAGRDFIIFEKESQIGGLCRTNHNGRHSWDFGVHAMYSRDLEVMNYFRSLPLDYQVCDRNARIFHSLEEGSSRLIDYPFENGVRDLPFRQQIECLMGYITARIINRRRESANLEEWIHQKLGAGIARYFMIPYNQKIWNCQLANISLDLIQSKIDPASAIEFVQNVLGRKRVGREYQSRFIYPKCGIQTLIDHTAKDIRDKIIVNAPVQRLIRSNQQWQIIVDGSKRAEVDYVVSTMPLVQLLEMINVDGVEEKYSELRWNDTYFVAIGLNTGARFKMLEQSHWVFFKEDEVFYRITMMKNFSSGFADTLVAEITNKGAVTQMSQEDIVDCVVRDLLQMRIIDSRKSIEMTDIRLLEHTYPIPTVGATTLRKHISGKLFQQNLFLLGRSGNWDYINMDGVIQKVNEFWFNIDCARH